MRVCVCVCACVCVCVCVYVMWESAMSLAVKTWCRIFLMIWEFSQ